MLSYFALLALGEMLCRGDQGDFGRKSRRDDFYDGYPTFNNDGVYESRRFERNEYWDDEYDEDECDDREYLEDC